MFVVLGATGNTGSVAARTLLAQGKSVRVVVHGAAKGEAWRAKGAYSANRSPFSSFRTRQWPAPCWALE